MKSLGLLRITLLGDGSSDRALLPVLCWLVRDIAGNIPIEPQWAELGSLSSDEKSLRQKVKKAMEFYPCDILFVHRDAEKMSAAENRFQEISKACANDMGEIAAVVGVVPIRMTESWLLISETAIRRASGNPGGRQSLHLPSVQRMEKVHAKEELQKAIRDASGLTGRRARKFDMSRAVQVVADFVGDFTRLDQLPSFKRLSADLTQTLNLMEFKNSSPVS